MSQQPAVLLEYMPRADKNVSAENPGDSPIHSANLPQSGGDTLASVLEYCEIRAFTPESVKAYKEQAARKANAWLWVHRCTAAIFYSTWLVFGVCVCMIAGSGSEDLLWASPYWRGLIYSAVVFIAVLIAAPVIKGRARWKIVPMWEYTGPIPEFARCYVREIRERLPEATFSVHQLVQRKRVLDPFLVASHNSEENFIAVWDEPEFKD